jgi:hypothetical protein
MSKGGYIKSWRRELDSDIWRMPPTYFRVWHYLIQTVSWEANTFPTSKLFGIHLNPGQGLFSISQIVDGVSWIERSVSRKPNKKTILTILKWLEFHRMICRESNGNGTFITICNWGKYQAQENTKVTESIPQGIPESIPHSVHTKEVEEDKEGEEEKINTPTGPSCPHQKIINMYHTICPMLPMVREWTGDRKKMLRTRWKEKDERQCIEWWKEYFSLVSQSNFLTGRVNDFQATLEWLVRPKNMRKVLEGNYKNKSKKDREQKHDNFDTRDYQAGATPDEELPSYLSG